MFQIVRSDFSAMKNQIPETSRMKQLVLLLLLACGHGLLRVITSHVVLQPLKN